MYRSKTCFKCGDNKLWNLWTFPFQICNHSSSRSFPFPFNFNVQCGCFLLSVYKIFQRKILLMPLDGGAKLPFQTVKSLIISIPGCFAINLSHYSSIHALSPILIIKLTLKILTFMSKSWFGTKTYKLRYYSYIIYKFSE